MAKKNKPILSESEQYANSVRNKIRKGVLPRFHLAKGSDGKLERKFVLQGNKVKSKLTMRQVSTFKVLCEEK